MTSTIHKFVSVSFKEDFDFAKMPSDWKSNPFMADPRDTRIKAMSNGFIFAYNFGALTFVDVDPVERTAEIAELGHCLGFGLDAKVTSDEFVIDVNPDEKPRVEYTKMFLNELTQERTSVIAQIMAQSAAMEYYESQILDIKTSVMSMIVDLHTLGRVKMSPRQLYRTIGKILIAKAEIVGVLHVLDRPEQIWDDRIMDGLLT
jgi:uncharacterized Rmd1/YagE family protein